MSSKPILVEVFKTGLSFSTSGVPSGGGFGGVQTPPKLRRPSKIVPNSTRLWKLLKTAEFRKPTPQDVRKKGSKTLKLPPVRNCFTLAMTNKLAVIINSLKVPKITKILLYEMKFLVPNYSCLQNTWLEGYRPQIPVVSVLNWICWNPPPEQNSWVHHCSPLHFYIPYVRPLHEPYSQIFTLFFPIPSPYCLIKIPCNNHVKILGSKSHVYNNFTSHSSTKTSRVLLL